MKAEFGQFEIEWVDRGREPQNKPDPKYPDGIDIDLTTGGLAASCTVKVGYPAPRCGVYILTCRICRYKAAVTTAGRRDDPRTVKVPCRAVGPV